MSPRSGAPVDAALRYHAAVKTLLVDSHQLMLQHCLARVGGRQPLVIATSKAQAHELLHHTPGIEVIVACEQLLDGSGLALLDEVHARWPQLIRVFCADRHRLALVRHRLSALRLRYTLTYPIRSAKLELLLLRLAHTRAASTIRIRAPFRPKAEPER
jgi:DNA-binding NarL/FixJ family response regulator